MVHIPDIPGYKILARIGDGSTATVWRARQESLDRDVAIKVLHPALWTQLDEADAFLAEAHSVALLKSRHVIQVYDVGRLDHTAYIVMEYVEGETLAEHLKQVGKMHAREAMQIVAAIADALADAWQSRRMIHRDIKPDNIIIENDGSVKLADLGLARQIGQGDTQHDDGIVGTPNYMSPEQATGEPDLSPATDMYSLGATLYHMLTGKIPFSGLSVEQVLEAQVYKQLPWPQDIDSHIPLAYAQFTTRLMMKNPEDRYADWSRVYQDAAKLAEGKLLMVKIPSEARSTVANAGKMLTSQKKVIKLNKRPTAVAEVAQGMQNKRAPAWLQSTLGWLHVAAAAMLIWSLLLRPLLEANRKPFQPRTASAPSVTTPPGRTLTDGRVIPVFDDQPAAPIPVLHTPDVYQDTSTYTDTSTPTAAHDSPTEVPQMNGATVMQEIIQHMVLQHYNEAMQFWEANGQFIENSAHRDILTEFMIPANMPDRILHGALARLIGRTVQFSIGGVPVSLEIERVTPERVQGSTHKQSGAATFIESYTFHPSELSSADKLRVLQQSTSAYTPYAEAMIALQGANYEMARERAAQTGPLENPLNAFIDEKIARLLRP
ncbi:MAG: serine/threonine-protein kinase [Kiritimatiellia bacterium]